MIRAELQPGVWLDARRAAFFQDERLLVVSDLHWGYATSHRARGNLLPDWGDEEIARHLTGLIRDYRPAEMLWLGDSLHTLQGRAHAEAFLASAEVPVTILPGNHDARWEHARGAPAIIRAGRLFHHGDAPPAALRRDDPEIMEVIGHHHPAFEWWDGAGGRLKVPALVWSRERMILPAFSPWAGGVPWNNRLGANETLWVVTPNRLFAVSNDALKKIRRASRE